MKFIIKETQACWVTWTSTVEAENEEQALEKFYNAEHTVEDTEIGDAIDFLDNQINIIKGE